MADVGLSIREGVAKGATGYRDPSKRNIGLLGQFIRGARFSPQRINSLEEFNNIFGGQSSSFFGPAIVKSLFDESDGVPVTLYLARVVGENSTIAEGEVTIEEASNAKMVVTAAYKGVEDPGAWGNDIRVSLYSYSSKVKDNFTLVISYKGTVETYHYGTLSEIQKAVNSVSKYAAISFDKEIQKATFSPVTGTITSTTFSNEVIGVGTTFTTLKTGDVLYTADKSIIGTVEAIKSETLLTLTSKALSVVTAGSVQKRVDNVWSVTLSGGVDETVTEKDFYPGGTSSDPTGLSCFDGFDVQILACTEFHSLAMAKVLNQYVQNRKEPLGVINLPLGADEGTAELYALELQTNDISFMAGAYMGWTKVMDEDGNSMLIPALGAVLGAAYIRTPFLQGDFIHIPPGGTDSLFKHVLEVTPQRVDQGVINRCVQQFSCNIIQHVEGTGYYVGSSRTYSTHPLYQSIHVRMQTSFYKRALNSSMRYLEQKPNTPELKREALVDLNIFYKKEYDNGALERSVPFETSYKGICDRSNNPPTQDRKLLNIKVLWIPTECTESVQLELQRNDGVLTITES